MNAIKDSIKSGRTVVGTTVTPNVDVSILADAGYDFLLFDTQHSAWEIKQLQPSIQTMRGKQAAPLVRVAANPAVHPFREPEGRSLLPVAQAARNASADWRRQKKQGR